MYQGKITKNMALARELTQYVTALNVKKIRIDLDLIPNDTWVQFVLPKTITYV